ncbi:MAG: DUF5677 domain-containing protein [Oscillospiraceae bacterium]|nr:DUF5677 domain-containing protein [Oscillospiraceae bacterium]
MIDFSEVIKEYFKSLEESLGLEGYTGDQMQWLFNDSDDFSEIYEDGLRDISKIIVDDVTENLDKRDKEEKNERTQTRKRFGAVWGEGLAWMRQFYSLALEVCGSFQRITKKSSLSIESSSFHKALYLLNQRAVLVYSEVLCLMENGFPDGAYAHYRTLYELWAVAEFLFHDEDREVVSLAFLESVNQVSNNESGHYKWAQVSKRFEGCDNITINAIVKKAHEKCMLKREQGRSNSKLTKDYTFPNVLIHPSAAGLEILSSSSPNAKTVGMANPAIGSSLKLYEISSLYLYLFADIHGEGDEEALISNNAFICNEILKTMLWDKIFLIFNAIEHGSESDN